MNKYAPYDQQFCPFLFPHNEYLQVFLPHADKGFVLEGQPPA